MSQPLNEQFLSAMLPAGRISITVEHSVLPANDLFTFAARDNPKRAFLFLSHVLGKHLPVSPTTMEQVHNCLAAGIPALPSPIVFIGMAETATGLGQGVFEAWLRMNTQIPAIYLHSTRYKVAGLEAVYFDEIHSHAPRQWFYLPANEKEAEIFHSARSLVLIDDEISTGTTLANLAKICSAHAQHLQHAHLCTITDFTGGASGEIKAKFDIPITIGTMLRGRWTFEQNTKPTQGFNLSNTQASVAPWITDHGYGRLGRNSSLTLDAIDISTIARSISSSDRVLVLGTGEFMHAPFVLARELARATRAHVLTHATTRSPILSWGPIEKSLCFEDNYGEGVCNYLYNFERANYDHVFLCHESGASHHLNTLATMLDATLLSFHDGGRIE